MSKEYWVTAALTNDAVVAELLIRMKQPSSSDSSPPTVAALPPVSWGHRKSRSKPSAIATNTNTNTNVVRKEQQSGSPTTPLCWSSGGGGGGGGASTSDGYDESSRPSDLSSGGRSMKGALGNEGATTSSYKKSRKRKSFAELKEEEDFLLKERQHLNRDLESMRVTMNQQIAISQNLRKFKIDFSQNPKKEISKPCMMRDDGSRPQMNTTVTANHWVQRSSTFEPEAEGGFVLPDLNMVPDAEEP